MAFPYVIPPMRPVTQADVHGAVNALLGNPKPRPRAGMFGGGKAPRPRENLQPARETVASKVEDTARNALLALGLNKYSANMLGQRTFNFLNDLTPVGSAVSFDQARQDYNQGNYGSALGNALLGALSAVPEVGKGAGVVSHAIIAPLFHGSPHKFEKFALEKIGTGEGAQAYGHGLYFAENPAVAQEYQRALSSGSRGSDAPNFVALGNRPLQHVHPDTAHDIAEQGAPAIDRRLHEIRDTLKNEAQNRQFYGDKQTDEMIGYFQREAAELEALRRTGNFAVNKGHLYEVKLDANPEDFLNWDAPLNEQPEQVRRAFQQIPYFQRAAKQQNAEVGDIYGALTGGSSAPSSAALPAWQGSTAYRTLGGMPLPVGNPYVGMRDGPKSAAILNDLGIPGIRYLDQGSRGAGAGTHNYVVFDPSIIDILNRN